VLVVIAGLVTAPAAYALWAAAFVIQVIGPGLALSAVLGLALTAALWWAFFGTREDESAEDVMAGAGAGLALAGGVLLFLTGDVKFRHALGFGVSWCRVAAAVAALAAWPVAVAGAATAAIALLTVIVAAALVTEFLLRRDTVNG
jgi:hypothetical protein